MPDEKQQLKVYISPASKEWLRRAAFTRGPGVSQSQIVDELLEAARELDETREITR